MTPKAFALLKTELSTDPLTRGYSGMSDQQAADSLNAKDRPGRRPIEALQEYCFNTLYNPAGTQKDTSSLWLLAEDVANGVAISTATDPNPTDKMKDGGRALCILLKRNPLDDWDFTQATLSTLLSQLVNADAMTTAHKDAIVALSNNQQSRASELSIGLVEPGNVAEARA